MHEFMMDILVAVIMICGFVLTGTVIPYIKQLIKDSEYASVYDAVETAVKAAEQKCKLSGQGRAKKAEVYTFISKWLETKRIYITEDEIDRLIEAAVFAMNNGE